jgi:hypothetical protein
MSMKNILQRLADLDGGGKKVITENFMDYGMGAPPVGGLPHTPATVNITAANGPELTGMLKDLMSLAGVHKVEPEHMPIDDPSAGPSKMISAPPMAGARGEKGPEMKDLIGIVDGPGEEGPEAGEQDLDDPEASEPEEPKMVNDSMNDKTRPYSNSPDEDSKQEGNFPTDGDQDNNLSAAKDKLVNRNGTTVESLFADYKEFVAESKKCNCSKKGKTCPVHGMKACECYVEEGYGGQTLSKNGVDPFSLDDPNVTEGDDEDYYFKKGGVKKPGSNVIELPPGGPKTRKQRTKALVRASSSKHIGSKSEVNKQGKKAGKNRNVGGEKPVVNTESAQMKPWVKAGQKKFDAQTAAEKKKNAKPQAGTLAAKRAAKK